MAQPEQDATDQARFQIRYGNAPSPANQRLASSYEQVIKAYEGLRHAITPYTVGWPLTRRPALQDEKHDYSWFSDYLGNALSQVPFAIQFGKQGTLHTPILESAQNKLAERAEEFTLLRARIAAEQEAQRLSGEAAVTICASLNRLEEQLQDLKICMQSELKSPRQGHGRG